MIVLVPTSLSSHGQNLSPIVVEYYRTYSTDACWMGDLVFHPSDVVTAPIASFEELLRAMGKYIDRGEKDFILVTHGSETELVIPIVTGSAFPTTHEILNQLRDYAAGRNKMKESLHSPQWQVGGRNVRAFADQKQLDRLADAIRKVRDAHLAQVHFRACNVGAGLALEALAGVLGARHTSGPNSWYLLYWRSTGSLPAHTDDSRFADRVGHLAYPRRIYSRDDCLMPFKSGASGDGPALALSKFYGGDGRPNIRVVDAISQQAIEGWTRSFFENSQYYPFGGQAPGLGYKRGHKLVVFGISEENSSGKPVVFPGDGFDYLRKLEVVNRP